MDLGHRLDEAPPFFSGSHGVTPRRQDHRLERVSLGQHKDFHRRVVDPFVIGVTHGGVRTGTIVSSRFCFFVRRFWILATPATCILVYQSTLPWPPCGSRRVYEGLVPFLRKIYLRSWTKYS